MRPFLPDQQHLFFGREELTKALVLRATETGQVLHTANTSGGDFTGSDDLINGIHSIIQRSIGGIT